MAQAPDYNAIYNQSLQQVQAANAPAVAAIGSQIPAFQQQQSAALAQNTAAQLADTGNQQTVTSREFGARGIPLSSGVYGQTLTNELGTLNKYYGAQASGITSDYANRIAAAQAQQAALQSQGLQTAAQNALSLYGAQNQAYQTQLQNAAQLEAARISAGPAYGQLALQQRQYNELGKLLGGSGNSPDPKSQLINDIQAFNNNQLTGRTALDFFKSYADLPFQTVKQLYTQYSRYGAPHESDQQLKAAYVSGGGKL